MHVVAAGSSPASSIAEVGAARRPAFHANATVERRPCDFRVSAQATLAPGVPERRRLLAKLPFEHEGQPNGPDGEDCDDDRNDEQVFPAKAAIEADVGDEESHWRGDPYRRRLPPTESVTRGGVPVAEPLVDGLAVAPCPHGEEEHERAEDGDRHDYLHAAAVPESHISEEPRAMASAARREEERPVAGRVWRCCGSPAKSSRAAGVGPARGRGRRAGRPRSAIRSRAVLWPVRLARGTPWRHAR